MRRSTRLAAALAAVALTAVALPAAAFGAEDSAKAAGAQAAQAQLAPPVQVQADGKPLDIGEIGHAAPFFADFDNDGKRDLLVGQFGDKGQGKLLVYKNQGTDSEPRFAEYEYLKVGADLGTVPAS